MNINRAIPVLLLSILLGNSPASPRLVHLRLTARPDRDSVVLRWAPTNAVGWRIASRLGYVVERVPADEQGIAVKDEYERRTKEPVRPWTDLECHFNINVTRNYTAIAAQMLYTEDITVRAADYAAVANVPRTGDSIVDRFNVALYCADIEASAATALGLRYSEKALAPGARYLYRVFVAGTDPDVTFDTATVFVECAPHEVAKAPSVLTAEGQDRVITLRWKNSTAAPFSAFIVSRSIDKGATYKLLTFSPIPGMIPESAKVIENLMFADTSAGNYFVYKYRVVGVTPFSERSAFAYCDGSARDLTPPHIPLGVTAKAFGPHRVLLGWRVDTADRDLDGFFIERSLTHYGGITLTATLLDTYKREYLDTAAPDGYYYYRVGAVDTAGNVIRSEAVEFRDQDEGPFAMPINPLFPKPKHSLTATYDSVNQRVTLKWDPPRRKEKVFYAITRKIIGGKPERYRTIEAASGAFEDLYLIGPGHYEYELRALPEDKNVDVADVVVP